MKKTGKRIFTFFLILVLVWSMNLNVFAQDQIPDADTEETVSAASKEIEDDADTDHTDEDDADDVDTDDASEETKDDTGEETEQETVTDPSETQQEPSEETEETEEEASLNKDQAGKKTTLLLSSPQELYSVMALLSDSPVAASNNTIRIRPDETGTYTYYPNKLDFLCKRRSLFGSVCNGSLLSGATFSRVETTNLSYDESVLKGGISTRKEGDGLVFSFEGGNVGTTQVTFSGNVFYGDYGNQTCSKCHFSSRCQDNAPHPVSVTFTVIVEGCTVTYTDGVEDEEIFPDERYEVAQYAARPSFSKNVSSDIHRDGYVFDRWEPELEPTVTGDVTYKIKWKCDGNHVDTTGDGFCDKEGCGECTHQHENGYCTEAFCEHGEDCCKILRYTVTYTDGVEDEEIFADQSHQVRAGDQRPSFEGDLTQKIRPGYEFDRWEPELAALVTEDVTYTVKWKCDGNHEDTDGDGFCDKEGCHACVHSHDEDGYCTEENCTHGDDCCKIRSYTVTYEDGANGTVFSAQTEQVKRGEQTPAFSDGTPSRPGYEFTGWNPEVKDVVSEDVTYQATWRAIGGTTPGGGTPGGTTPGGGGTPGGTPTPDAGTAAAPAAAPAAALPQAGVLGAMNLPAAAQTPAAGQGVLGARVDLSGQNQNLNQAAQGVLGVRTGDDAPVGVYLTIFAAALAILAGMLRTRLGRRK